MTEPRRRWYPLVGDEPRGARQGGHEDAENLRTDRPALRAKAGACGTRSHDG